ncbi:hypothetical protein [Pseudonocardia sp. DLS-67]
MAGPAVQYVFDEDGFYEDVADKLIEHASAGGRHDRRDHSLCVLLNDAATVVDGSTYADLAGEGVEKGLKRMGVDETVAAAFSSGAKIAIKKAFDGPAFGNLPKAFRATIPLVCPNLDACPTKSAVFKTYMTPLLSAELRDVAERLGALQQGK